MIQQVNLYKDILRQNKNNSWINFYTLGLSIIVLFFIGFSINLLWELKNTKSQVLQSVKNLDTELARVKDITSKLPKQEIDTQLAGDVLVWQNMLNELTQTTKLLSGKDTAHSPGFSSYFQALANQSIPDVWLSALYFDEPQQIINIEGSTFKPEKVPYFLQQLQKEPIFNGHSFAKLIMEKSDKITGQLDFKLNTTLEASPTSNVNAHAK